MLACLSRKGAIPILGWSIDACDYSGQPTLRSWGACVRPWVANLAVPTCPLILDGSIPSDEVNS